MAARFSSPAPDADRDGTDRLGPEGRARHRRRGLMNRVWASAGAIATASAIVGVSVPAAPAAAQWWSNGPSSARPVTETREIVIPHVPDASIAVSSANGKIEIRKTDREDVKITALVRGEDEDRIDEIDIVVERAPEERGSGLSIKSVFGEESRLRRHDSVSYVIEIPDANGVTARTSNGSISIHGLSGEAVLNSSNGAVHVREHTGAVRASTSNGRIEIDGGVDHVHANSSNGRVAVTGATGDVTVRTSNGRITVEQGGGASGVLDLSTSNASVRVGVAGGLRGTLSASTSNGRINVDSALGEPESSSRNRATLRFDDDDARHTVRTSNGSITLSRGG